MRGKRKSGTGRFKEKEGMGMVKIVIASKEMIREQTIRAVERGIAQKEDKIIYVDSLEAARRILTPERLKMLGIIKREKPASLYALAKLMGKDFRAIYRDVGILSEVGLIQKENYNEGHREKTRVGVRANEIHLSLSI
jgi:predicted transcriptional regulator